MSPALRWLTALFCCLLAVLFVLPAFAESQPEGVRLSAIHGGYLAGTSAQPGKLPADDQSVHYAQILQDCASVATAETPEDASACLIMPDGSACAENVGILCSIPCHCCLYLPKKIIGSSE